MLKPRLIPVLLFKNGVLVRSQGFEFFQSTGDPTGQVERFTDWKADELIYLDITRDDTYNTSGTMQVIGSGTSRKESGAAGARTFDEVIAEVAKSCSIPLTVGGKIRTVEDARRRLRGGADKVSINSGAFENPALIGDIAHAFGSQCVVVSVDVKRRPDGSYEVFSHFGERATGRTAEEWSREAERQGAGEILLNSIDQDGMGEGYDLELVAQVAQAVSIPVIALGGVGRHAHLAEGFGAGASAAAAANIFHFTEQSILQAKRYLRDQGIPVRF